jgi:hypothetical protein
MPSMQKLVKYGCPASLAVLLCVAITGLVAPWPVAEQALGSGWARESVLIGASYRSRFSGDQSYERRTRSYLGLPGSARAFRIVTVVQENGAVRVEEARFGLVPLLAGLAALLAATCWSWCRPRGNRRHRPH